MEGGRAVVELAPGRTAAGNGITWGPGDPAGRRGGGGVAVRFIIGRVVVDCCPGLLVDARGEGVVELGLAVVDGFFVIGFGRPLQSMKHDMKLFRN